MALIKSGGRIPHKMRKIRRVGVAFDSKDFSVTNDIILLSNPKSINERKDDTLVNFSILFNDTH